MTNSLDLSSIFDVYSMRERSPDNEEKRLTTEFRNRVSLFCKEMVHPYEHHSLAGHRISGYWMTLRDKLRYRYGLVHLADKNLNTPVTEVEAFLSKCPDEHFLDFIEMFFHSNILPAYFSDDRLQDAVNTVNKFFDVDELPYRLTGFVINRSPENTNKMLVKSPINYYTPEILEDESPERVTVPKIELYPQVIRRDSDILHETAIEPTLTLLSRPMFASANEEFLDALKDFRDGDYRDCVVKCGSSLESVMKVICDRKGWPYQQTDAAAKLLDRILSKTTLDPFFEQPIMLIATIRNRLGKAHGAGTQQKAVSRHVASYVINATASAILLLVEETKP